MPPSYLMKDLTVEITRKCPMKCTICSSEGGARDPAELTLAELRKITDEAKELGTAVISLSGGEPLECPHVIDYIRYVKQTGLKLHLYTCGNLISGNQIQAIPSETFAVLKSLSVDKIIFSIHGPTAEIHEKITSRAGSFENLITSIKRAQESGHIVELHFVPVLQNFESLPAICKLAEELGVRQLSVLRFVPQGRGAKNRKDLEITGDAIQKLEGILKHIYEKSSVQLRFGSPFNCFNIDNRSKCSAGIDKAILRPDGFLFPCVSLKRIVVEDEEINIRNSSLKEIWSDSRLFTLIRSFHEAIENGNCRQCVYFHTCGGGCLTHRMIDSDDLRKGKDPYCQKVPPQKNSYPEKKMGGLIVDAI
jgi:radical SAM protein with 4Fe4S-binding SPASM domain